MDAERFDSIVRHLTTNASRRGLLGGVVASAVGLTGAGLFVNDVAAKKGGNGKSKGKGHGKGKGKKGKGQEKKITICHKQRQTISISRSAWPAHQAHGDTEGACPCDGLNENDACTIPGSTAQARCCSGVCTPIGTSQNCRSCAEICSGLTPNCDPALGCTA